MWPPSCKECRLPSPLSWEFHHPFKAVQLLAEPPALYGLFPSTRHHEQAKLPPLGTHAGRSLNPLGLRPKNIANIIWHSHHCTCGIVSVLSYSRFHLTALFI